MKNNGFKDALILCLITVIAGGVLGFVNNITQEPIQQQEIIATQKAYESLFKEANNFKTNKDLKKYVKNFKNIIKKSNQDFGKNGIEITGALLAKKDDSLLGYIILTTSYDGYGGVIDLSVGVDLEGKITGIEILTINETVGLGMRAQDDSFKNQFVNKQVSMFNVVKTGKQNKNEIDALSGATFTSKAFTNAVNGALLFYQNIGGNTNE